MSPRAVIHSSRTNQYQGNRFDLVSRHVSETGIRARPEASNRGSGAHGLAMVQSRLVAGNNSLASASRATYGKLNISGDILNQRSARADANSSNISMPRIALDNDLLAASGPRVGGGRTLTAAASVSLGMP